MSHYEQSPGQQRYLKKHYAELAELAKDEHTYDTPFDGSMTIAEAREAARLQRRRVKLATHPEESDSPTETEEPVDNAGNEG